MYEIKGIFPVKVKRRVDLLARFETPTICGLTCMLPETIQPHVDLLALFHEQERDRYTDHKTDFQ